MSSFPVKSEQHVKKHIKTPSLIIQTKIAQVLAHTKTRIADDEQLKLTAQEVHVHQQNHLHSICLKKTQAVTL